MAGNLILVIAMALCISQVLSDSIHHDDDYEKEVLIEVPTISVNDFDGSDLQGLRSLIQRTVGRVEEFSEGIVERLGSYAKRAEQNVQKQLDRAFWAIQALKLKLQSQIEQLLERYESSSCLKGQRDKFAAVEEKAREGVKKSATYAEEALILIREKSYPAAQQIQKVGDELKHIISVCSVGRTEREVALCLRGHLRIILEKSQQLARISWDILTETLRQLGLVSLDTRKYLGEVVFKGKYAVAVLIQDIQECIKEQQESQQQGSQELQEELQQQQGSQQQGSQELQEELQQQQGSQQQGSQQQGSQELQEELKQQQGSQQQGSQELQEALQQQQEIQQQGLQLQQGFQHDQEVKM